MKKTPDQSAGKIVLDGLVAILMIAGTFGAAILAAQGHPYLGLTVFVVCVPSAIAAFNWLDDHND